MHIRHRLYSLIAPLLVWVSSVWADTPEFIDAQAGAEHADDQRHWAFEPPRPVDPPQVQQTDWPRDDLDRFLLARMEAEGLQPVKDASPHALVRRVYFDLVGLPPTAREIKAFVANGNLEELVDRLLNSPRFGERWGRHWLDVVRYAESSGMEFNFTYPHAWPYRDYVIDALNEDKPFDVFLTEQIAGDLIEPQDGDTPVAVQSRRVASSLLAFGPKRHNSGGMEFRMDVVDDQIDTVTRATLGLTVACARCHDHKFDPIPTRDYYALAGIFLSTEPLYGTIKQKYSNNPTDLVPIGPNAATRHTAAVEHEKETAQLQATLKTKQAELKKAQEAEKTAQARKSTAVEQLAAAVTSPGATTNDGDAVSDGSGGVADEELREATELLAKATAVLEERKAEVARFEALLVRKKKGAPSPPNYAMSARDRGKPIDAKVAVRGNFRTPGDVVPRGFLTAVTVPDAPAVAPKQSGRLQLARWIANGENPLTARVMVNRIWHHLFGRGLVPTVDNFGVIGKRPSHPQLLDVLALRFVRDGWSVKRMVRTIVLSRAYQLSTRQNARNAEIDPDNRLLWRATPRRLQAEAIRDALLSVSGQLDLEKPDGSSVTGLGDKLVRGIAPEKIQPPSRHRSVYLPVVRDYVPEFLDLFDFPSPSLVSGQRSVTNVPSQALYLRNSAFVADQARHAARRLLASATATDDSARVELSMLWAMARQPSNEERIDAMRLLEKILSTEPDDGERQEKAWAAWFHTLFATAEFRYLVDAGTAGEQD